MKPMLLGDLDLHLLNFSSNFGNRYMLFLKVHHAWPFTAENLVHPVVFSFPCGI